MTQTSTAAMAAPPRQRSNTRRRLSTIAAVLLAPVALLGQLAPTGAAALSAQLPATVTATATGPTTVTGGELGWGVRQSIRNYLENFGHTEGFVLAEQGAKYARGDAAATFPNATGWIDAAAQEAELSFAGGLHMFGFGTSWLHFDQVRLSIADHTATITVNLTKSYGTATPTADVVLATFPLTGDDALTRTGNTVTVQSGEGTFPEDIATNHLPRMDGQATYGGDNAYTDPFTLTLELAAPAVTPEPEPTPTPTPTTPVPTTPQTTAPHGESSARNSSGAELTVSPAYNLGDSDQRVQLSGTGFPTVGTDGTSFGGLYVLFGWVDPAAGAAWGPGSGGASGRSFTYTQDVEPQGTYQSMVSYPGNDTVPGFPTMTADGSFTMELPILSSRFESQQGIDVDCYLMQCGVLLIGAHGKTNAAGEIFVPVYFTDSADETGTEAPTMPVAAPPSANPNVQATGTAAQGAGFGVNGGLASLGDTGPRTALFAGLLLLSAGALGAALLRRQRLTRAHAAAPVPALMSQTAPTSPNGPRS